MFRDFHSPGRSAVMACEAMAATSHPLATEIAIATLRAGGTAADAAVAAVAALGVVEPHMTGIGGDCFCLVAKPGAPLWGYNGSGRSAAAARPDVLIDAGHDRDRLRLRAFGHRAGRGRSVGRGARGPRTVRPRPCAGAGDPPCRARMSGGAAGRRDWGGLVERLRADPGASRHYLVDGRAPRPGDIMRFPALAATLKSIAARGPRAFYEDAADDIVATRWRPAARGSSREDFAAPSRRAGDADRIELSRARRGGIAAQRPGPHRARAAQYSRELRPRLARSATGRNACIIALEAARLAYGVRDAHCRRSRPICGSRSRR